MVTKDLVIKKLKTIDDPELGINIVDLGLIYGVSIDKKGVVFIKMTLTTPGCPLGFMFNQLVGEAIKKIKGVRDVKIEITFDPPWTPEKMAKEAKSKLGMV